MIGRPGEALRAPRRAGLRIAAAIVVGVLVAGVVIMLVEAVSAAFYPLPEGVDPYDRDALAELIGSMPTGALVFVLLAWACGALAGAATAGRIGRPRGAACAWAVGGLIALLTVVNLLLVPHPWWFWSAGPAAVVGATWIGARLGAAPAPLSVRP